MHRSLSLENDFTVAAVAPSLDTTPVFARIRVRRVAAGRVGTQNFVQQRPGERDSAHDSPEYSWEGCRQQGAAVVVAAGVGGGSVAGMKMMAWLALKIEMPV